MSLLDTITDGLRRIVPDNSSKPSKSTGGIGHGMIVEDDMIVPKAIIVFHTSQIFFNFLAMACFASVAAFQAKWHIGPSGLSGFTIFLTVMGIFFSAFMMLVPVLYEKYDRFVRLARALKEIRVGFILTGTGTAASLLIAFIDTISAWTEPGCKDPKSDPNASLGDDFQNQLPGWCNTKKAGSIFLWLAFAFWGASLGYLIYQWRQGKLYAPRDPPFQRPESTFEEGRDEEDEEADYHVVSPVRQSNTSEYSEYSQPNPFDDSNRPSAPSQYTPPSRPSMDAYGAFSDPAPSGFGATPTPGRGGFERPPIIPEQDFGPKVSRTMQYADPYAAVRASIAGGQHQPGGPPSYESYQGYR